MTIREATFADLPRLLTGAERFLASSPFGARVSYNAAQLTPMLSHLISLPTGAVLVTDGPDGISSGLGLMTYPHPLSGAPTAGHLFWVSVGRDGVRLVGAAEQWARERGAAALHMVAPSETLAKLYTRRGFHELERVYEKELV